MGAPFESWSEATDAIYPGLGSGEVLWLVLSIVICVVAIWMGGTHEAESYRKVQ